MDTFTLLAWGFFFSWRCKNTLQTLYLYSDKFNCLLNTCLARLKDIHIYYNKTKLLFIPPDFYTYVNGTFILSVVQCKTLAYNYPFSVPHIYSLSKLCQLFFRNICLKSITLLTTPTSISGNQWPCFIVR